MKIAVIMSTYNGEKYIREQIDSILNQENVDLDLFIRDDGSKDDTTKIIKEYADKHSNIHVDCGVNVGFRRSFISLLLKVKGYDYYAFSDQDDYWRKNKLSSAIQVIEAVGNIEKCVVYYSNLKIVDGSLNYIKTTNLDQRKQTLQSAFSRRSIAGCTMVFNKKMYELIDKHEIVDGLLRRGHDSFIITLCYAVGGDVICDSNAYIQYRQHESNASGGSKGSIYRLKKEWNTVFNKKGQEPEIAKNILNRWSDDITEEAKNTLELVSKSNTQVGDRLKIFFSRQFTTGDLRLTVLSKIKILLGML